MKKRLIAFLLVAVLSLSLAATAFAEGSRSVTVEEISAVSARLMDKDGKVLRDNVKVSVTPLSKAKRAGGDVADRLLEAYDDTRKMKSMADLGDEFSEKDLPIILFDVDVDESIKAQLDGSGEKVLSVTFKIPYQHRNKELSVAYKCDTEWKAIPGSNVTREGRNITVKFTELCPVLFYVADKTASEKKADEIIASGADLEKVDGEVEEGNPLAANAIAPQASTLSAHEMPRDVEPMWLGHLR